MSYIVKNSIAIDNSQNGFFVNTVVTTSADVGVSQAFVSGGRTPGAVLSAVIDEFPMAVPFVTSTNVGSLSQGRYTAAGQSGPTHAFTSGGQNVPSPPTPAAFFYNTVDRFPITAPFSTATDIGDLVQQRSSVTGQASRTQGYTSGGYTPPIFPPGDSNTIDRFPFAVPFATATDTGDLFQRRSLSAGQSSAGEGYTSGGRQTAPTIIRYNTIDRFSFSLPFATATDTGDLSTTGYLAAGISSSSHGYTAGGSLAASPTNTIDRFPFSAPFTTATDVGDLTAANADQMGSSGITDGFVSGVSPTKIAVDKFPFSAPFVTATDAGDITQARLYGVGQQG